MEFDQSGNGGGVTSSPITFTGQNTVTTTTMGAVACTPCPDKSAGPPQPDRHPGHLPQRWQRRDTERFGLSTPVHLARSSSATPTRASRPCRCPRLSTRTSRSRAAVSPSQTRSHNLYGCPARRSDLYDHLADPWTALRGRLSGDDLSDRQQRRQRGDRCPAYPCPPTAAQLAAKVTCTLAFGDEGGKDGTVPISFVPNPTASNGNPNTAAATTSARRVAPPRPRLRRLRRPRQAPWPSPGRALTPGTR